ncbi:MAG: RNA methyltransferase [Deltaproteobacteria bacterium]|nr:RNA methyltransferase [Deltaproteobacteria bacterium]
MNQISNLENISVILVKTKTPGNIGSIARCMMNMGLSRLILVRPPEYKNGDALRMAAGAHGILERAEVFPTLKKAVAGHGLVYGTTRQIGGHHRKNLYTAREAAERVVPLLSENRIGIVFGREVNGLDNDDIALCNELISIPSSDAFPSLNLSHAVMVVAYELFVAAGARLHSVNKEKLADVADLENFYEQLEQTVDEIRFFNKQNPKLIMLAFRQMFGRARLDDREVRILRGFLSHIDETIEGTVPDLH